MVQNSELEDYFDSSGANHRILSRKEEVELAQRAEKGDKSAKDKLVRHNLRLAAGIANNFSVKWPMIPLFDFISEANKALTEFVVRIGDPDKNYFDWRLGNRFSTFAYHFIRRQLMHYAMDRHRVVRVPRHAFRKDSSEETKKAASRQTVTINGIDLTDKRISEPLDDVINRSELEDRRRLVKKFLGCLSDRQRDIIERRFGLNGKPKMTLGEIGQIYGGITKEAIRQAEAQAIRKIQRFAEENELQPS